VRGKLAARRQAMIDIDFSRKPDPNRIEPKENSMSTITVKDLTIAADLDGNAMNAVRGGYSSYSGCFKMPSCHPYQSKSPLSSSTTTISVDQYNQQSQNNATGNGSATFGGGIQAENNQQAFNVLGGFGGLRMPA
jgi:hypothetical protein